ncbi:hypothetical protein D3C79_759670 [compost metagenome]
MLAGDVQRAVDAGQAGQVQALRVVAALQPWRPVLAAVASVQQQVENADCKAVLFVSEPDIQKRFVGAFLHQPFSFRDQRRPTFVLRCGLGLGAVVGQHLFAQHAAVQLLLPTDTAIAAVQDHAVITHRPALLGAGETHGIEVGTGRHAGLLPMAAVVIGIQNVPTRPDSYQARANAGYITQRADRCQGAGHGRQIQHIHVRCGLCRTLKGGPRQHQRGTALERIHTGSSGSPLHAAGCSTNDPASRGDAGPYLTCLRTQRMPAPARDSGDHWVLDSGSM